MADSEPANEPQDGDQTEEYIQVQPNSPDDLNAVASASEAEDNNDEEAPPPAATSTAATSKQTKQQMEVQMALNDTSGKSKEEEDFAPTISESAIRKKSIREEQEQRLRIVVEDIWADSQSAAGAATKQSGDNLTARTGTASSNKLRAGQHESSLISRVTSILIDEVNDDTQQFETSIISLPKSPICALLLMESVGVYQQLDRAVQASIIASIIVTILAQIAAGSTVFTKQLYSLVEPSYDISDGFLNLVVISFIVIYLSQDCAQIYKQYVLLRWMRRADRLKRHATVLIAFYLVTNALLYMFLLYYSIVELLINRDIGQKLQAAVAVYFILELDDWLYNVTIEPLKILEDEMFDLKIRGRVGSRSKRLRHVTYWFWSIFTIILVLQLALFLTKTQENLTIEEDPSP
eukprot:CAMPEP_0197040402 /NCGR_PEP_ID=MMETSP1384-20130603/17105_1 /TAXON_ID=29189 /ORGANISM="Ammonia sp." /LENGTH=406 /DNA_ID=CAMNT_0042471151 /DNA_START=23 /DNA_END=1243 /DNA_ORIENTATION=+